MSSDGPAALISRNRRTLLVLLLILISAGICGMTAPGEAVPDVTEDRTYGLSWPEIWELYEYYPAQEWFSAQSYQLFSETAAAYPGQIFGVQYDGTVILWVNVSHPLSEEETDTIYHQWSSSAESAGVTGLPMKFVLRAAPLTSSSTELTLTADRNGVVRLHPMYRAQGDFLPSPDAARSLLLILCGACAISLGFFRITTLSRDPASRPMQISAFISMHPGCSQREIIAGTGFSRGSLLYQLRRLVREKLVREEPYYGIVRYFPYHAQESAVNRAVRVILLQEKPARVFRLLAESDGLQKEELENRLGLSLSTVEWHLGRFVRCGVVEKTEESGYKLSPEAESVWDTLSSADRDLHSSDSF